jgi:hypothetical protein
MRSDNWLGKFWTRLRAGVVQDVPASLEECETCREVDCTEERWAKCERRIAAEAASLAASGAGLPPGRTGDLPGMFGEQAPQAAAQESEQDGEYGKRRKNTSH